MRVRVLMFGALAEAAAKEDVVDLPEGATADDVVAAVRRRYPPAAGVLDRVCIAVNQEVVTGDHAVNAADEVALLPPMSGGARITTRLSTDPSVPSVLAEIAEPTAGATVLFVGTVRSSSDAGPVDRLEYTAYDSMAESVMSQIGQEAADKWGLIGVAIEHGVGSRVAGETTFVVACAAPHRDEAFEGCRYIVDEVKRRVPIWKKECGPWGERWIGL